MAEERMHAQSTESKRCKGSSNTQVSSLCLTLTYLTLSLDQLPVKSFQRIGNHWYNINQYISPKGSTAACGNILNAWNLQTLLTGIHKNELLFTKQLNEQLKMTYVKEQSPAQPNMVKSLNELRMLQKGIFHTLGVAENNLLK